MRHRRNCAARCGMPTRCWFRCRPTRMAIRCCGYSATNSAMPRTVAIGRLSFDDRRLWRLRRRLGRRGNAGQARVARAAGNGSRPNRPGKNSARAVASRSLFCGLPASMGRAKTHWCRSRSGQRPPHRQARPGLQPHSCRRHRASHRCRVRAPGIRHFQCRRRRTDAARRSDRVRRATHGRRSAAGNSVRGGGANHVADGVEFLAGVPPRAQRQAEERTWRQLALSDLSRGLESVACAEMNAINGGSDP